MFNVASDELDPDSPCMNNNDTSAPDSALRSLLIAFNSLKQLGRAPGGYGAGYPY